jgi:hypothetical protein
MPNELAFIDPQAWREIYGHRQGHPQFHKDPIHVGSVQDIPGSTTLTMADDANHARQRRTLAHAFSQKALLEQESIIRGYVDLLIEKLTPFAARGEPVNMCDWFSKCAIAELYLPSLHVQISRHLTLSAIWPLAVHSVVSVKGSSTPGFPSLLRPLKLVLMSKPRAECSRQTAGRNKHW